jgi:xylulokinase
MSHYLGLDLSTQSLSALVVDVDTCAVVYEKSVNFGTDLPEYHSPQGFLSSSEPPVYCADPLMWCAALDLLFTRMCDEGFDFSQIKAVSGSAQQHGSVYCNAAAYESSRWSSGERLVEIVAPLLARKHAPIWMDSSTTRECREIADAVGGDEVLCQKSGSVAIERFTASQIRKFAKELPHAYAETGVIHLVSSFLTSLLAGVSSYIDTADGAGMNLLNLETQQWDEALCEATAPDLGKKLPTPVPSDAQAGFISPYLREKYGFDEHCIVTVCSGDNPNSLVGLGASEAGTAVISLGTSDTLMAAFSEPVTDPRGYGHVFCNPAGGYMCLLCFSNGSLAREKVRDEFSLTWPEFNEACIGAGERLDSSNMMIPFYVAETTPRTAHPKVAYAGEEVFTSRQSADKAVQAVVESQMANMKLHSAWALRSLKKIKITGGASRSDGICQIVADTFQVPVERFEVSNSAGLGAALRAASSHGGLPLDLLAERCIASDALTHFVPNRAYGKRYELFADQFRDFLDREIS